MPDTKIDIPELRGHSKRLLSDLKTLSASMPGEQTLKIAIHELEEIIPQIEQGQPIEKTRLTRFGKAVGSALCKSDKIAAVHASIHNDAGNIIQSLQGALDEDLLPQPEINSPGHS